jgi:MFS family permease
MRVPQTIPALAAFAALGVFWGIWSAVLPAVSITLKIGDDVLGLALLCVAAGAMPAMLIAGRVTDRLGTSILAPAVAMFGIAAALPGLAQNGISLGLLLLILGATSGGLDVVMNAVSTHLEAAYQTRILHFAHATFSATVLVCSILSGMARQIGVEYRIILFLGAALILVLALVVYLTISPLPPSHEHTGSATPIRAGRGLLRWVLILGGLCGLAYLVENGLQLWSAQQLERNLYASPAIAGFGPGLLAGASAVGRLIGHRIGARIGDRMLLVVAGIAAAAASFVFANAPTWEVGLVAIAVAGAAISIAAPSLFSIAGRQAPAAIRGTFVSNVATFAYTGFLIGPALLGITAHAIGLRGAITVIGSIAVILAIASIVVLPRHEKAAESVG